MYNLGGFTEPLPPQLRGFCSFVVLGFFSFLFLLWFFFKVSDQSMLEVHKLLKKSTITLVRFLLKAY